MKPQYFDTKITSEKNNYLDERWLFIGRLKVGSVPGMINKGVPVQLIIKSAIWTGKLFTKKNFEICYSLYSLYECGLVKAQIL